MIEVEMAEDVRKTKTKAVGRFTVRQFVCIIIAASYSIPIAFIIPGDIIIRLLAGFFPAMPVVMCGWIKFNKQPFEIVLMRYIYKHFLTPTMRKAKRDNPYKTALGKAKREEEKEAFRAMSPKKKELYMKKKRKGKQVKYSGKKELRIYR